MTSREDFVGTIISAFGEECLLTEFLGEGAEAVVFANAPLEDPSNVKTVLKFDKTSPFLEMDVLHYSLRVHEELYPTHPLLMPAEVRMRLLTEEMLARIRSSRFEFRVRLYQEMMHSFIVGLARVYSGSYFKGELQTAHLLDPSIVHRLDGNLLYRIQEGLDEDSFVDELVPFFEYLVDSIPPIIETLKQAGVYRPCSSNALCNLLGLYLEGFINEEELAHIASDERLSELIDHKDLNVFFGFLTLLYIRARNTIKIFATNQSEESPEVEDDFEQKRQEFKIKSMVRSTTLGFNLLGQFASSKQWYSRRLQGISRYWFGKTMALMMDDREVVQTAFESALRLLTEPSDLGDRHDVLLDLVRLVADSAPSTAEKYIREAIKIEEDLGIPPENRTRLERQT